MMGKVYNLAIGRVGHEDFQLIVATNIDTKDIIDKATIPTCTWGFGRRDDYGKPTMLAKKFQKLAEEHIHE